LESRWGSTRRWCRCSHTRWSGSSRALSVSTTSTLAALTGAAVGTVAGGDADRAIEAATTLAILTGVLLIGASVFKLGFIADFISQPVLAGFKAGTGLLIAVGQLGKVLGSTRPATTSSRRRTRR
jgi:SulP family sulfate permease